MAGIKLPEETIQKILELYAQGHTQKAIARELRIAEPTVLRYVRESGLPHRTRGALPQEISPEEEKRIVDLYLKGYSTKWLIDNTHHSWDTIKAALRAYNVVMRSKGKKSRREDLDE